MAFLGSLEEMTARGVMAADWAEALRPVSGELATLSEFLDEEQRSGRGFLPAEANVLRAFTAPMARVRVLILGQDPYPTPGHPIGLAFAVDKSVSPLPRSLANIFRELVDDLAADGAGAPADGDLSPWEDQGVLLLNRVLTVQPGAAGSHRRKGWERVTECAIEALVARPHPLVAVLWGKDAEEAASLLGTVPIVASAHPSPLSARRGFFGSRPFSRVNDLLVEQGAAPIDWVLPSTAATPALF